MTSPRALLPVLNVWLAIVFFAPAVYAQTTPVAVTGRVVAFGTQAPIAGATLTVGRTRVVSDVDGRFVLPIEPGQVLLEIVAPQFVSVTQSVTVVVNMAPLDIVLSPSQEFRDSVTVSGGTREAAPTASTIELPPLAVERVAGAADNIFRALQTLPGVSATDDFGSRLAVRGGGPDQNLTVMDGVEIHNPYRLFGLTSAFNPELVNRFDLTAGGFGAKYGDRLSSILLVDNRSGRTDTRLSGTAALSLTDTNVVLEGRLPAGAHGSWLVTGRRTYYDLVARRFTDNDLPSFGDLQAKLAWQPRPGQEFTFFAVRSREKTDSDFGDTGDRVAIGDLSRNDVVALTYARPVGSRASSRTIAAWYVYDDALDFNGSVKNDAQRSNSPADDSFSRALIIFTRDLAVRDVSVRQEFGFQANSVNFIEAGFDVHVLRTSWGSTISGDRNPAAANGSSIQGGAGLPSFLQSTRDTTRSALWLQDRVQIGTRLRLEPGLRVDRSGFSGETIASPRFGINLELTPHTRVRGAVGRYTQSPGYEKLLQADYFVDLTASSSQRLVSERSTHALAALEHSFAAGVTGRIEGYYKSFDQMIVGRLETPDETSTRVLQYNFPVELQSSVPTAPIITSFPVNAGSGRSYGMDVYIEKKARAASDRLSGWASYTFGKALIDAYGRDYPFDYDRRHALSIVGTVGVSRRIDLSATWRVASGFPNTPPIGVRVAPTLAPGAVDGAPGSLIPLRDARGALVWTVDNGSVGNLNSGTYPTYARLDVRVTFKPRSANGRWQVYVEILNALDRKNVTTLQPQLDFDPTSDRPKVSTSTSNSGLPRLPSFGVRYRF